MVDRSSRAIPARLAAMATACIAALVAVMSLPSAEAASSRPTQPREIVQLGDSYSAGNGAGEYLEKTCLRSPNNYGAQVARTIGASYRNVACSGGVLADLTKARNLGSVRYRWATYAATSADAWMKVAKAKELCGAPAQSDWRYTYTLGRSWTVGSTKFRGQVACQLQARPQVEAITPGTTEVFLTIGGNDAKFAQLAQNCLVIRNSKTCRDTIEFASAELDRLRTSVVPVLRQIRAKSQGRAKVYLLGYPSLINRTSYRIPEFLPSYDAGAALATLQAKGNQVQREALREAGQGAPNHSFTFVDVSAAWQGMTHSFDPRMVPNNRNTWIIPPFTPRRITDEWLHPTRSGWDASALALGSALR